MCISRIASNRFLDCVHDKRRLCFAISTQGKLYLVEMTSLYTVQRLNIRSFAICIYWRVLSMSTTSLLHCMENMSRLCIAICIYCRFISSPNTPVTPLIHGMQRSCKLVSPLRGDKTQVHIIDSTGALVFPRTHSWIRRSLLIFLNFHSINFRLALR